MSVSSSASPVSFGEEENYTPNEINTRTDNGIRISGRKSVDTQSSAPSESNSSRSSSQPHFDRDMSRLESALSKIQRTLEAGTIWDSMKRGDFDETATDPRFKSLFTGDFELERIDAWRVETLPDGNDALYYLYRYKGFNYDYWDFAQPHKQFADLLKELDTRSGKHTPRLYEFVREQLKNKRKALQAVKEEEKNSSSQVIHKKDTVATISRASHKSTTVASSRKSSPASRSGRHKKSGGGSKLKKLHPLEKLPSEQNDMGMSMEIESMYDSVSMSPLIDAVDLEPIVNDDSATASQSLKRKAEENQIDSDIKLEDNPLSAIEYVRFEFQTILEASDENFRQQLLFSYEHTLQSSRELLTPNDAQLQLLKNLFPLLEDCPKDPTDSSSAADADRRRSLRLPSVGMSSQLAPMSDSEDENQKINADDDDDDYGGGRRVRRKRVSQADEAIAKLEKEGRSQYGESAASLFIHKDSTTLCSREMDSRLCLLRNWDAIGIRIPSTVFTWLLNCMLDPPQIISQQTASQIFLFLRSVLPSQPQLFLLNSSHIRVVFHLMKFLSVSMKIFVESLTTISVESFLKSETTDASAGEGIFDKRREQQMFYCGLVQKYFLVLHFFYLCYAQDAALTAQFNQRLYSLKIKSRNDSNNMETDSNMEDDVSEISQLSTHELDESEQSFLAAWFDIRQREYRASSDLKFFPRRSALRDTFRLAPDAKLPSFAEHAEQLSDTLQELLDLQRSSEWTSEHAELISVGQTAQWIEIVDAGWLQLISQIDECKL